SPCARGAPLARSTRRRARGAGGSDIALSTAMTTHSPTDRPRAASPLGPAPAADRWDRAAPLLASAALALLTLCGTVMTAGLLQCISGGGVVTLAVSTTRPAP
ncbi:MAG: hypothetical protein JWM10_1431, partial [Myxococcaceae bacterium]|nr:hypothetical protein [Myxococcaceae bacterium]